MNDHSRDTIDSLFGSYKAEWLQGQGDLFELFTKPDYFPELLQPRPCILVGGRGTGKTTALRCLCYQGGSKHEKNPLWSEGDSHIGVYHRINTNRVTSFTGEDLGTEDQWIRWFGHYVNLTICLSITEFLEWSQKQVADNDDLTQVIKTMTACFDLRSPESIDDLNNELRHSLIELERSINSGQPSDSIRTVSMLQAPIEYLTDAIIEIPRFSGKIFFVCVDEYENLLDYQQRIFNTLIKHGSTRCFFKIGVRDLGWRERCTLNSDEQLTSPADYVRINISERLEKGFDEFASSVCLGRLKRAGLAVQDANMKSILPTMSTNEEAIQLGVRPLISQLEDKAGIPDLKGIEDYLSLNEIQKYTFLMIASTEEGLADAIKLVRGSKWSNRFNNYCASMLFTIRKGKSGIRKYYCGWDTYLKLSGNNIRYLLSLVHNAVMRCIEESGDIDRGVSCRSQTQSATEVGHANLGELEGVTRDGAALVRLTLCLGRIFQIMASNPVGHTPEVTQFSISDKLSTECEQLIRTAVRHLALVRMVGSKPISEDDTKEYDYSIHPIYSAFFTMSYRKKRKIGIRQEELLAMARSPDQVIEQVLTRNNRQSDVADLSADIPEQLSLFGDFFGSN